VVTVNFTRTMGSSQKGLKSSVFFLELTRFVGGQDRGRAKGKESGCSFKRAFIRRPGPGVSVKGGSG